MLAKIIPWSLRGLGPFLNTYGDSILFRSIGRTPPIPVNPDAATAVHSAVPHRYRYAYLAAAKSFLRFFNDVAVIVHDDGSLRAGDYELIERHLPGVRIISRTFADQHFAERVRDPFLSKVRSSYTSYLKLFDSTLFSADKRIVILDTDTLFLRKPDTIIDWCTNGGAPWFHRSPKGQWKTKAPILADHARLQDVHIQALVSTNLDKINEELKKNYRLEQGFCSGFIGYPANTIRFDELKDLLQLLYAHFGERIFLWGAEQTVHGMVLCGQGARGLPVEDYFVFTRANAARAHLGTFVHFVGENRFYRFDYPRLARQLVNELR